MSWDLEKKYWRTITETNQTENKKKIILEKLNSRNHQGVY